MTIKLNEWVIYGEDGLYFNDEADTASFKTKAHAVDTVAGMRLDVRPRPKIKRIRKGWYEYFPKDVGTHSFGDVYTVERVTKENIR